MAATAPWTPALPLWVRAFAWIGGHWAFMSQRRAARLLQGFACTEEQSQLELRLAARACTDEQRKARYLRHALDETRHARAFAEHAGELARAAGAHGFARPSAGCEALYERLGELRFVAFVHLGEQRGRAEFETYAQLLRKRGSAATAQLFEGLIADERHHESYTAQLLTELGGVDGARRAVRWVRRWQAWREFRRRGRKLASVLYGASMLLVYVGLFPFALSTRLLGKTERGFSRGL